MGIERREFMAGATAATVAGTTAEAGSLGMYGLIGKMLAQPGRRDDLVQLLLAGTGAMPGCLSYIVANDAVDPNAIWITEVWDSAASHQASLKLPAVQAAISKARPIIAGFGERFETTPVGGVGLPRSSISYFR